MNIVILGAGRVGEVLTEQLQNGEHDLTVVDVDRDYLQTVQSMGENIKTVPGDATLTGILNEADVQDADMLIAVTGSDSVNIVASQYAKTFFDTPSIIARVRSLDIESDDAKEYTESYLNGVTIVNPESLATQQLQELLQYPGAHQVLDFCDGKIKLVALRISDACPLLNRSQSDFNLPARAKVIAAFDSDGTHRGDIEHYTATRNDMLVFIAPTDQVNATIASFVGKQQFARRICIAGLGRVGWSIATALMNDGSYRVDLIEVDFNRADQASEQFPDSINVHNGSAHDRTFLVNCDVDNCDVFCATTNNDEINVLAALEALNVGAKQAVALVSRGHYKRILTRDNLIVTSLEQITANSILSNVIEGAARTYVLHTGVTEIVEIKIEGEHKDSKVAGRKVSELKIPGNAYIAMIVRGDQIVDVANDSVIHSGDNVIVFIANSRDTAKVVRYFQVKATALFL